MDLEHYVLYKSRRGWHIGSIVSSLLLFLRLLNKSFIVSFLYRPFYLAPPFFSFCLNYFFSPASDDTQKSQRSRYRVHKSCGSSHKTTCRSFSCDSQSKGSVSTPRGSGSTVSSIPYSLFTLHYFFHSWGDVKGFRLFAILNISLFRKLTLGNWRWLRCGDIGGTSIL